MIADQHVIRAHWIARLLFYLVPAFFSYFVVIDYWQLPGSRASPREGVEMFWVVIACLVALELFILGRKITLERDRLVYRYLGLPLPLSHTIPREAITGFVRGQYRRGKTPASYVKIFMSGGRHRKLRLNLSMFGYADIRLVYQWLAEARPNPGIARDPGRPGKKLRS